MTGGIGSFYTALEARNWEALRALLHPDVLYEVPQTRARIRGRDAYVRFNRQYPGEWQLQLLAAYDPPPGREHLADPY